MIRSIVIVLALLTLLAAPATSQQMETNDPGGSLTSGSVNPTPGTPFVVDQNGSFRFEVGGGAGMPYALFLGDLAQTSLQIGALGNQWFDLALTNLFVVGDGISASGGALPWFLFFLNSNGTAVWNFPAHPSLVGQNVAFQAIVQDPTQALSLNITAAAEFTVSNVVTLTGSEVKNFVFPSGPYPMYGTAYTNIDVSTAGWVRFGGGATNPDAGGSNRTAFINGTVGQAPTAAPILCALWTPLTFTGGANVVTVSETSPGVTRIDWNNGTSTLSNLSVGSFSAIIDVTAGAPNITLDFNSLISANLNLPNVPPLPFPIPGFTQQLVGVTDGGLANAQLNEVNLVSNGVVNPVTPPGVSSVFQDFSPAGTNSENPDLDGVVMSLVDLNAFGQFILF